MIRSTLDAAITILKGITWEEGFGRSTEYLSQFFLKGCTNMGVDIIDEDDFSSHHVVHVGDIFGNLFLLVIYCTNVKDC